MNEETLKESFSKSVWARFNQRVAWYKKALKLGTLENIRKYDCAFMANIVDEN